MNPDTKQIAYDSTHVQQSDLDRFKKLFAGDAKIEALTIAELVANSVGKDPNGVAATGAAGAPVKRGSLTDCEWAVGGLVVDVVLVGLGLVGIHGKVNEAAIQQVVHAVQPSLSAIEKIALTIGSNATIWEQAKAVKDILLLIYSGGMLEAVYKAIVSSLTWWDMALYGILGLAELTAAFLTDGAALLAVIAAELAQVGFVISDSVKVANACN